MSQEASGERGCEMKFECDIEFTQDLTPIFSTRLGTLRPGAVLHKDGTLTFTKTENSWQLDEAPNLLPD